MSHPPPKINRLAPTFNELVTPLIERAANESQRITIASAIELCRDIGDLNGTANDCVIALLEFERRLIDIQKTKANKKEIH